MVTISFYMLLDLLSSIWLRILSKFIRDSAIYLDHQKKQENSRKTYTSASLTMPKPWTVWITTNWKVLKEMGIPDCLTCLLRNLYAGQEATVITGYGTTDWFQIGKEVHQSCILSPCFFNLYAEYIMGNARLDEAQAGIKIAGRNINNLRYADEKLKSLLIKVKEDSVKLA